MKTICERSPGVDAGELLDQTLRQYQVHRQQIQNSTKGWQQYCTGYCMAATDIVKTILQQAAPDQQQQLINQVKKKAPSIWDNIAQELKTA